MIWVKWAFGRLNRSVGVIENGSHIETDDHRLGSRCDLLVAQ